MSEINYEAWEPVMGLEIHAQLNTRSKLFSSAANRFGDEPNTNVSAVCSGQPGSLPVLNREVVKKAVQFGCAIGADVQLFSTFDRKSYFYPDCPRNFQITQFDKPIILGGSVLGFAIERAHIEDDAGMLKHFSTFAGVDDNRAGAPLIEIVSTPCFSSPKEASTYAQAVRAILQYIDASNCNMEEGSMRMDANISVRKVGETELRPKVEIKNMNSFSNMEKALEFEFLRQVAAYEMGNDIKKGTYRFNLETGKTVMMREKEDAADYRYFPEPDLPPLVLTKEYVESIELSLPELPYDRHSRYMEDLKLAEDQATILVADKKLADYFEEVLKFCSNSKRACNWLITEFAGRLQGSIVDSEISSEHVGALLHLLEEGTITGRMAKEIADEMVQDPNKDPCKIVSENPKYQPVTDTSELEPIVDQVLADNPDSIAAYKNGRTKALAFLVGQVMKATQGKASPEMVNKILTKKIT